MRSSGPIETGLVTRSSNRQANTDNNSELCYKIAPSAVAVKKVRSTSLPGASLVFGQEVNMAVGKWIRSGAWHFQTLWDSCLIDLQILVS